MAFPSASRSTVWLISLYSTRLCRECVYFSRASQLAWLSLGRSRSSAAISLRRTVIPPSPLGRWPGVTRVVISTAAYPLRVLPRGGRMEFLSPTVKVPCEVGQPQAQPKFGLHQIRFSPSSGCGPKGRPCELTRSPRPGSGRSDEGLNKQVAPACTAIRSSPIVFPFRLVSACHINVRFALLVASVTLSDGAPTGNRTPL